MSSLSANAARFGSGSVGTHRDRIKYDYNFSQLEGAHGNSDRRKAVGRTPHLCGGLRPRVQSRVQ